MGDKSAKEFSILPHAHSRVEKKKNIIFHGKQIRKKKSFQFSHMLTPEWRRRKTSHFIRKTSEKSCEKSCSHQSAEEENITFHGKQILVHRVKVNEKAQSVHYRDFTLKHDGLSAKLRKTR